jgi:hypothetical protein
MNANCWRDPDAGAQKRKEAARGASGPKSREETPKEGTAATTLPHRNNMRVQRTKSKCFFCIAAGRRSQRHKDLSALLI